MRVRWFPSRSMCLLAAVVAGCTGCQWVRPTPVEPTPPVASATAPETTPIAGPVPDGQSFAGPTPAPNGFMPGPWPVQLVQHAEPPPSPGTVTFEPVSFVEPPEVRIPNPMPEAVPGGLAEAPPDGQMIDLGMALQLTAGQNPQVAFAMERIEEAFAQLRAAEVMWVPSLRGGFNYNKHEGRIQDVAGNIIETSRGSIYTGLGAQAVGAGSPAVPGLIMNFHLRDAVFQPAIADRVVGAREAASRATTNDTLLNTALAYIDLLEAAQLEAVARETLANAEKLAEWTDSFARAGQGLQADADRAQTELAIRGIEVRRAGETTRVAAIRLNRLLSQDPTVRLVPQEPALVPIDLVQRNETIHDLVAIGLANRPELAESGYLVDEAVLRLRRERFAPLVPSVLLGMSYGVNGGGLGSDMKLFGDRVDFDAVAFWEIRNLGLGERAARDTAHSRVHQVMWQQIQVMDQVASEVAEAHTQLTSREQEMELARQGIRFAEDSYRRNSERIRDGEGLPLETLQSVVALDQARRQYVRAVADYNRSQFRLQRAVGWPIAE